MRLYVVRHADPDYTIDGLTEQGHREARALADRLQDVRIDRLYASPLGRAQATAQYTAEAKGLTIQTLDWTAELTWRIEQVFGDREQVAAWNIHGHRVRNGAPLPTADDWHTRAPLDDPAFHQQYAAMMKESDSLLAEHGYVRDGGVYRVDRPNREAIAVFCHGGFGLTWLAYLLAVPLPIMWVSFFLPPSSLTTVVMDERGEGVAAPRALGVADVSHLYATGQLPPGAPAGIVANYE